MKYLSTLIIIWLLFTSCSRDYYSNTYVMYDPNTPEVLQLRHGTGNFYNSPNGEEITIVFSHDEKTFDLYVATKSIEIDVFFFDAYNSDDIDDEIKNVVKHTRHELVIEGIKFIERDVYALNIGDFSN